MQLHTLSPAQGSKRDAKRAGRGIGSGLGKTGGRGHKGQKSRTGGSVKPGFEGGQMPIQRRLPKFGFKTQKARETAEIRLGELNALDAEVINLDVLKSANLVTKNIRFAKVILSGELSKAVKIEGLRVTKGARQAIEAAGGSVAD